MNRLEFDPRGERLATGCDDGTARVYLLGQDTNSKDPLTFVSQFWTEMRRPVGPVFVDHGRGLMTSTGKDQLT